MSQSREGRVAESLNMAIINLEELIGNVCDVVEESLDPVLTREQVIKNLQRLEVMLNDKGHWGTRPLSRRLTDQERELINRIIDKSASALSDKPKEPQE